MIRVLNESSVNDGGDFSLLWLVIRSSNQLDIVLETHFSCDTVDCGLWLALLKASKKNTFLVRISIKKRAAGGFFVIS